MGGLDEQIRKFVAKNGDLNGIAAANKPVPVEGETKKRKTPPKRGKTNGNGSNGSRAARGPKKVSRKEAEALIAAETRAAMRSYDSALKEMVGDVVGREPEGTALRNLEERESRQERNKGVETRNKERERKLVDTSVERLSKSWNEGPVESEDVRRGMERAYAETSEQNPILSEEAMNEKYFALADEIFAKGYSPNQLKEWKNFVDLFPKAMRTGIWPKENEYAVRAELMRRSKGKSRPPIVLPRAKVTPPKAVNPVESVSAEVSTEDWDDGSSGPMTYTDISRVDPSVVESVRPPGQPRPERPRVVTKAEKKARAAHDRALGMLAREAAEPRENEVLDSYKSALRTLAEEGTEMAPVADVGVSEVDAASVVHDTGPALPADRFKGETPKSIRESLRRSILTIREDVSVIPPGSINTLPPTLDTQTPEPPSPDARAVIESLAPDPAEEEKIRINEAELLSSLTPEERALRAEERAFRDKAVEGLAGARDEMVAAQKEYLRAYYEFNKNHSGKGQRAEAREQTPEWQALQALKAVADGKSLAYQRALDESATKRLSSDTAYRQELMAKKAAAYRLRLIGAGNAPRNPDGSIMTVDEYRTVYMREYEERVARRYGATVAWNEVTVANVDAETRVRAAALGEKQKNIVQKVWAGMQKGNNLVNEFLGPNARTWRLAISATFGATVGVATGGAVGGLTRLLAFGMGLGGGAIAGRGAGSAYQSFWGNHRLAVAERARQSRIGTVADLERAKAAWKTGDPRVVARMRAKVEAGAALIGGFAAGFGTSTAANVYGADVSAFVTSNANEVSRFVDDLLGKGTTGAATISGAPAGTSLDAAPSVGGGSNAADVGPRGPESAGTSSGGTAGDGTPSAERGTGGGALPTSDSTIQGGEGSSVSVPEGTDDMRAVSAEVRGGGAEYVARPGDGGIKMIEGLRKQMTDAGITDSSDNLTVEQREILAAKTNAQAEALAKKYGLYQPGVPEDSASIGEKAKLGFVDGKLTLTNTTGSGEISATKPYTGARFDTNPPAPEPAPERVMPREAPPPSESVAGGRTAQPLVPREEPPYERVGAKSYWDMTENEKTSYWNRQSIANAPEVRESWERYGREYTAYEEATRRENAAAAAPAARAANVQAETSPRGVSAELSPSEGTRSNGARVIPGEAPAPVEAAAPQAVPETRARTEGMQTETPTPAARASSPVAETSVQGADAELSRYGTDAYRNGYGAIVDPDTEHIYTTQDVDGKEYVVASGGKTEGELMEYAKREAARLNRTVIYDASTTIDGRTQYRLGTVEPALTPGGPVRTSFASVSRDSIPTPDLFRRMLA